MKVLHLNTYDLAGGGAARAVHRLHNGLGDLGVASQMLVQIKSSQENSIVGPKTYIRKELNKRRRYWDSLLLKLYPRRNGFIFSPSYLPENLQSQVKKIDPDIIHLHWIADGFVRIETIAGFIKPVVWTFHDSWPFTGGCHIPFECSRYVDDCGTCPALGSEKKEDLSFNVLKRKKKSWKNIQIAIVTPSHWLRTCAEKSALFRNQQVRRISNGLDLKTFMPVEKSLARKKLSLPDNKKIILFGANNPNDRNKGFHLLLEALKIMENRERERDYELVTFGGEKPNNCEVLKIKSRYLGTLRDDKSLALLYSAADVFVSASIQENLSNMVMEGLACGTPSVAFNIGGTPDLIEHGQNGFLVTPYDTRQFAEGIDWVLSRSKPSNPLSFRAREKANEEFGIDRICNEYLNLYKEILKY